MGNISIMYLLQLAWKRIWLLIIAMVVFAIAAFGYCKFFATPEYSAKASIIVTNGSLVNETIEETDNSIAGSDLSASNNLSNTVIELMKTGKIYDAFMEEYGEEYEEKYDITNSKSIRSKVTVVRREKTNPFIDVTVVSTNKALAQQLANDFSEFACRYVVRDYLPRAEIVIADVSKGVSLVFPRPMFTTVIAAFAGAVIMFGIVFLFDTLNQSIRGEEEFSMKFDIPIIGSVPDFGDTELSANYYKKGGYSSAK